MINDNENEAGNEKQITQIGHKKNLGLDMDTNIIYI